jgi:hypothetical protein
MGELFQCGPSALREVGPFLRWDAVTLNPRPDRVDRAATEGGGYFFRRPSFSYDV